jgi:hypothetical protein
MRGVLTSPIWLVQACFTVQEPVTLGKGEGFGLSGALEQADNTHKLVTANQRPHRELNKRVTWCFLSQWPGWQFLDPSPKH